MFKKIALAAALVATASFATWDKFPVLENHKGQAAVGISDIMQDKMNQLSLGAKARYTVAPNLELGLEIPFVIFTHWDGEDVEDANGLADIPLMVRYQFMPNMNAFLDISWPTCNEDLCGEDGPVGFHFGAQYSQNFGMVNFGSELGLAIETKGDDKTTPPWELNLGVEGDFAINPMLTPYVGLDLAMLLGKYTYDGENMGDSHTGDLGIGPYLGLGIAFNPMITLDLCAQFILGKDYLKVTTQSDEMVTALGATLFINF